VLAAGLLFNCFKCLTIFAGLNFFGWCSLASRLPVNEHFLHFLLAMVIATILTIIVQFYRIRTVQKMILQSLLVDRSHKMKARAQRLESMGTMVGGLAHDLNNTLTPITMSAEMLSLANVEPKELVQSIQQSSDRAAKMVRQLLSYVKGTKGEKKPTRAHLIIDDSVELIKVSLPSNISMDCHYEACACSIECNSTELDQLLVNLCVNAKDAMPNGGKITLRLDELHLDQAMIASMLLKSNSALPGRYARFTFEDTGTGIDDEHLDRIFDPFFTTKPPEKGSGLGLSIVAGIVKGHRGLLHIRSRKDVGTTFEVYFPVLSGTKTDEQ